MKSPTIYRYAANRQYEEIPERVRSHPDDLFWTDRYGSTALHLLCQAQLVDEKILKAVESIVRVAPELVSWSNVATWTPLHFAVEQRLLCDTGRHSSSLILLLIDSCPSSVNVRARTGFRSKTAFHIACDANTDYRVLDRMLEIQPSLSLEPFCASVYSYSENPLQILWKHYKPHRSHRGAINSDLDRKMELLLKAAMRATTSAAPQPRTFRLINAVCSIPCPLSYVTRVFDRHREDICSPDEDGRYALHYAVLHAQKDNQTYTQFIVERLVQIFPQAARIPDTQNHGRLPLQTLALSMTWHKGGLKELCYSYTDVLRRPDPLLGLVPFQASALSGDQSRLYLSTTYELLRTAPEMVGRGSGQSSIHITSADDENDGFGVFVEHTSVADK